MCQAHILVYTIQWNLHDNLHAKQFSGDKCLTSGEKLTQDAHMEVTYIAEWDIEPQNAIYQI